MDNETSKAGLGTKAYVGLFTTVALVIGYAAAASAAAPPPTPASEAKAVFDSNWQQVIDLLKTMAPVVIGAGLLLLAIRKVVGAVKRGKAPSF